MSPGPPAVGGVSPPVMVPGSAPPFQPTHQYFQHHYHQTPPGKLRDRSPRLSVGFLIFLNFPLNLQFFPVYLSFLKTDFYLVL